MQQEEYFYCYNINVSKYLSVRGIKYITVAREPKSNKLFSLYKITQELKTALNDYSKK